MGNAHCVTRACRVTSCALLLGLVSIPVRACETGTVRDAAFQQPRNIHRLYVIADAGDVSASTIHDRLRAWLAGFDAKMNIELRRVNADDPSVLWQALGIPSVPPRLPVVALVGLSPATRLPFVIDHWEPAPSEDDLAALQSSPVRELVKKEIVDYWAVILHSPGVGPDHGASQAALDAVAKKWAGEQPPGIKVVRFDRNDPRERLLCAVTGIDPSAPDWAGVVFGRGKLMAPPLVGKEITESNLNALLERLTELCTCLQDSVSLGLDIPMLWDEGLDAKVAVIAPPLRYVEVTIDGQLAELEAEVPDEGRRALALTLIPLGAAMMGAVAVVTLTVWRGKRERGAWGEQ